jgi:hypothetical protein
LTIYLLARGAATSQQRGILLRPLKKTEGTGLGTGSMNDGGKCKSLAREGKNDSWLCVPDRRTYITHELSCWTSNAGPYCTRLRRRRTVCACAILPERCKPPVTTLVEAHTYIHTCVYLIASHLCVQEDLVEPRRCCCVRHSQTIDLYPRMRVGVLVNGAWVDE